MNLEAKRSCHGLKDVGEYGGARCSTIHPYLLSGGSLWQTVDFDDDDDLVLGVSSEKVASTMAASDCNQSYNPMSEPNDDWPELLTSQSIDLGQLGAEASDEVNESKFRAFLDEKAFEQKKLQTPLYQFYNSLNVAGSPSSVGNGNKENVSNNYNLPPKSRSPCRAGSRRLSTAIGIDYGSSPRSCSRCISNIGGVN